jgi:sensor histidine kinase regulating citrate/malate metabolism
MKKKRIKKKGHDVDPPSLVEVWKWKDAVYKDIKDLSPKETVKYFNEGAKEIIKKLGLKTVKTVK